MWAQGGGLCNILLPAILNIPQKQLDAQIHPGHCPPAIPFLKDITLKKEHSSICHFSKGEKQHFNF